jgi:protein-tyrosine-phosphatase
MSKKTHAFSLRLLALGIGAALACGSAYAGDLFEPTAKAGDETVAFVCNFGSVKSLMAAARFNALAEQRGLPIRAISRAASEKTVHQSVPEPVVKNMAQDGWQVESYKPKVLTREEASSAVSIVHIPLEDLTQDIGVPSASGKTVERWEGIPSAVRDYKTAKSMLMPKVDALFEEMARKQASVAATK